jgi:protein TonB
MLLTLDRAAEYDRNIRIAAVLALAAVIGVFLFVQPATVRPFELRVPVEPLAVSLDRPLVEVPREPPRVQPVRAAVPIADPLGKETDSSLISNRGLRFDTAVVQTEIPLAFWAVQKPPKPVRIPAPDYPEMARAAGIEGLSAVCVIVGKAGAVDSAWVQVSSGNRALDEAAVAAALLARFEPGYQRDLPVRVQMSIPYRFRLQ